jgi:D-alanine-D-alanine ligase
VKPHRKLEKSSDGKINQMNIVLAFNIIHRQVTFENDAEAEHDSKETIKDLENAIKSHGYKLFSIEADENFYSNIKKIKEKIDLVFNMAEGKGGEGREAYVPAILDALNIPYTGSSPLTMALTLDKGLTKALLAHFGIPTSPFQIINCETEKINPNLKFPLFIKPNNEGSSKGIDEKSIINTKSDLQAKISFILKKYNQPALIEEYLPGQEFSAAILGNYPNETVFPIMHLNFGVAKNGVKIDTFKLKQNKRLPEDFIICPAKISQKLENTIKDFSIIIYRALRCKDLARIDFRLNRAGAINFLEINPLPTISSNLLSGYQKAAKTAGLDYKTMIKKIIEVACVRYGIK